VSPFAASNKAILAIPLSISDRAVSQFLGVPLLHVGRVRTKAANAIKGRTEDHAVRNAVGEPVQPSKDQYAVNAPIGSRALLAAHLAYHAKYNARSTLPPLAHAGTPR
jgi:hypothetical protein